MKSKVFGWGFIFLILMSLSFIQARIFQENNVNYIEVNLKEQWNLIAGISFSDALHSSSYLTKDAIFKSYYHDAKTNKDIEIRPDYKAGNVDPLFLYSNAFWVFSAKPGKIVYKASPSFVNKTRLGGFYQFYAGDNLIAINDEMYGKTINQIKGDCSIVSASFWDALNQSWISLDLDSALNFETQEGLVGKGIRVKVAGDCRFFTGEDSSGFNGYVSIATLKDEYITGEVIQLTDPPEELGKSYYGRLIKFFQSFLI
jgi:hypothetical protein